MSIGMLMIVSGGSEVQGGREIVSRGIEGEVVSRGIEGEGTDGTVEEEVEGRALEEVLHLR